MNHIAWLLLLLLLQPRVPKDFICNSYVTAIIILIFSYAKSVGARHFHTSAKQNKGIEDLFLDLTQQMMSSADAANKNKNSSNANNSSNSRGNNITIVDDSKQPKKKSGCCGGGGGGDVVDGVPIDAARSQ